MSTQTAAGPVRWYPVGLAGAYLLHLYVETGVHPAAALHQARFRPMLLEDFAKLPSLLKEARKGQGKAKKTAKK